jgi:hypothetical protein
MGKNWRLKVKTNMINRLALKFVNSHCKCKSNWKLAILKFEREMDIGGNEGDV